MSDDRFKTILQRVVAGSTPLAIILVLAFCILAALMLAGSATRVIQALGSSTQAPPSEVIRNNAFLLAGIIGGGFAIWRGFIAERQADTAQQGLFTERFTKAVEQLGSEKTVKQPQLHPVYRSNQQGIALRDEDGNWIPEVDAAGTPVMRRVEVEETVPNLEVRLGGIYALERLAKDSPTDHITIMEVLCAYIRENAEGHTPTEDQKIAPPRVDIAAILDVIARRSDAQKRIEADAKPPYRPDLSRSILSHLDLRGRLLKGVNLRAAELRGATLVEAQLQGAHLVGAQLRAADLAAAQLQGADLSWTQLQGARLFRAQLQGADLSWTQLQGAYLGRAAFDTFSQCSTTIFTAAALQNLDVSMLDLSQDQVNSMFGDRGTVTLPEGIEVPEHWKTYDDLADFNAAWEVEKAKHGLAD
ncbi:MAG: pentapeptide repeat-containing protein [Pseudomonadota bacterium]